METSSVGPCSFQYMYDYNVITQHGMTLMLQVNITFFFFAICKNEAVLFIDFFFFYENETFKKIIWEYIMIERKN